MFHSFPVYPPAVVAFTVIEAVRISVREGMPGMVRGELLRACEGLPWTGLISYLMIKDPVEKGFLYPLRPVVKFWG
jgi:hypothetical protein